MDWLLSPGFWKDIAVLIALWLTIVLLGYYILVEGMSIAPRVAVRWLYGIFVIAAAGYMALASIYRLFFVGTGLWVLAIVVALFIAFLFVSYGSKSTSRRAG